MGYRAHVIKQHREYGNAVFWNYDNFEKYQEFLYDAYPDEMSSAYGSETEEYYEIPKVVFEKEIERLEKLPPDDIDTDLNVENKYIIEGLKGGLAGAPATDDNVAMEWF